MYKTITLKNECKNNSIQIADEQLPCKLKNSNSAEITI